MKNFGIGQGVEQICFRHDSVYVTLDLLVPFQGRSYVYAKTHLRTLLDQTYVKILSQF